MVEAIIPKFLHYADPANDEENCFVDKGESEGVRISQGRVPGSEYHIVRGITTAKVDVEWLAARMVTTTTEEFRHSYAMIDPLFIDGMVLNVLSCDEEDPKSCNEPFFNIKWAAFDAGAQGVVWNRDACYLEYVARKKDAQGRDKGVGACLSIDYPECHSLEDSHSLIRSEICGGYIAEYTDTPGVIKLTYMMQIDAKGDLPAFVANLAGVKQGTNVARIRDWVEWSTVAGRKFHVLRNELETPLKEAEVPKRGNYEFMVGAGCPGFLHFEFCTSEKDIGVSVHIQSSRSGDLTPVDGEWGDTKRRFEVSDRAQYGSIAVQPGEVYTIRFDNSYSMFTGKHVYFRTRVEKVIPGVAAAGAEETKD